MQYLSDVVLFYHYILISYAKRSLARSMQRLEIIMKKPRAIDGE